MDKLSTDKVNYFTRWAIAKHKNCEACGPKAACNHNPAYEVVKFDMNMLLNAGINVLWTLVCSSSGTKFDNTNAYLGVGDSSTAESAAHTDLQAATNKLRKAMDATYPTYGTSQKATWKSTFGGSDANYAWNEFGVFNASTSGTMLNRKVSAQGTKTSGQTWELTLDVTLS
jgi:hypothetical protein